MRRRRRPIQLAQGERPSELRLLAISDIRSQPLAHLVSHIRQIRTMPDLILYAGDDVERFREAGGNYFEALASLSRYGLVAVIGNDDGTDARAFVTGHGVYEVHTCPVLIGDVLVVGLEGAPDREDIAPVGAPLYPEDAILGHLELATRWHRGPVFICSHAPPFEVLDTAIRFGDNHIGSQSLRGFILRDQRVKLVICGHCHRGGGKAEQLNQAVVINAASHDGPRQDTRIGEYTWRREWEPDAGGSYVSFDVVRQWGELEKVTGLWRTDYPKLSEAGILTLEQLAGQSAEQLGDVLGRQPELVSRFPALARALILSAPQAIGPLYVPASPRVYFDIETDPWGGHSLCWLIGTLDEASGTFVHFLASTPTHEAEMLQEFARYCAGLGERYLVSYSGSDFDRRNLILRMRAAGIPVPRPVENAVDLYYSVQRAVALPVTGNRLKELARCLGFKYRHRHFDGVDVAYDYLGLVNEQEAIPQRLLEYNQDDVYALQHIVTHAEQLAGYGGWPPPRRRKKVRRVGG